MSTLLTRFFKGDTREGHDSEAEISYLWKKGALPTGCTGYLLHEARCIKIYTGGDKPSSLREGQILVVTKPGPYTLEMALDENLPELGLRLQLQSMDNSPALITLLVEKPELSSQELIHFLRGPLSMASFTSAMDASNISSIRAELSNTLLDSIGMRCIELEFIDLGNQVSLSQQLLQQAHGQIDIPQSAGFSVEDEAQQVCLKKTEEHPSINTPSQTAAFNQASEAPPSSKTYSKPLIQSASNLNNRGAGELGEIQRLLPLQEQSIYHWRHAHAEELTQESFLAIRNVEQTLMSNYQRLSMAHSMSALAQPQQSVSLSQLKFIHTQTHKLQQLISNPPSSVNALTSQLTETVEAIDTSVVEYLENGQQ